ncbi:MAG: methyltransferase domain-containing protein [Syntrophobacterales bacterium]|nr:MAG: methyltransferase domain-containing protein [Syntrophobacterales bacterium]
MRGEKKFPGLVPFTRREVHEKIVELLATERRGKLLDVPAGSGALAGRLQRMGFDVSCCDIQPSLFAAKDLTVQFGDMNKRLPYRAKGFDYIICLDGIEHTESPFNTIREFGRILKGGGKLFLSIPNFLNIERRFRFLLRGTFSKIPSHDAVRDFWKGDLSMAHLNSLGYPLLKFIMEHYGFRILGLEMDCKKPRMNFFRPIVWIIRLCGHFTSKKRRELYRLDETLMDEIIMGGNTLIIVAEKVA